MISQNPLSKAQIIIRGYLNRNQLSYQDIILLQHYPPITYFTLQLHSDANEGLSTNSIQQNRNKYGSNKLGKKQMKTFCSYLKDELSEQMLVVLIIVAIFQMVVEGIYSQERNTFWIEGVSILVAVAICSLVASFNDYQKQKQFQQLNRIQQLSNYYEVIRDGCRLEINRQQIVVGDLLIVVSGIQIPVDGLLLEGVDVIVDETYITGESIQIYKQPQQKCIPKKGDNTCPSPVMLSGSKVMEGQGKMLVLIVGEKTQYGKSRKMMNEHNKHEQTPLEQKLEQMADQIGKFGLYSGIFILSILLIRLLVDDIVPNGWNPTKHLPLIFKDIIIGVSILVVAIPQGLPLSVTVSLAFSVKKMLNEQNLVRRLVSCQTMGGANYICSDKTGTLTQNKMQVVNWWNLGYLKFKELQLQNHYKQLLLNSINLNSSAHLRPTLRGSQTQIALLKFGQLLSSHNYQSYRIKGYFTRFPFNSDRKRMSTGVIIDGKKYLLMKGASQIIINCCDNMMAVDGHIQHFDQYELLNEIKGPIVKGVRTVGLAFKEISSLNSEELEDKNQLGVRKIETSGFTLLGIAEIEDLPRIQSKEAIEQCKDAGINVIMVTGDSKGAAERIAKEVGILQSYQSTSNIIQGYQLENLIKKYSQFKENNSQLIHRLQSIKVVYRSHPQHKLLLVSTLKQLGNVVAVTGDGINDVPALLKADVGFAMGKSGTQAAKNASDIIILNDNFNSIVRSIVWGRNIYDSVKKFLQIQLTANLATVIISIISSSLIRQSVLTAVQMLWVDLVMDTLASLALATQPPNTKQMLKRKPYNRNESLISPRMLKHIIGQTILQIIILCILLFFGQQFIPEYGDKFDLVIGDDMGAKYSNGGQTVASGMYYTISGQQLYYGYFNKYHIYSRHFTFIFNTFVFMQLFNYFNCRRIHDQLNIFSNLTNNWIFFFIIGVVCVCQFVIVECINIPFRLYAYGLTYQQWILSIAIAAVVIPFSIIFRMIPTVDQNTFNIPLHKTVPKMEISANSFGDLEHEGMIE